MSRPPQRALELTDPRALRALAHPTRLKLLTLLRTVGPLTASQAAERTGESAGSCSFHFRQLAKWGLCESAGGGHGREHPWRATAAATSWSDVGASPEMAEASRIFSRVVAEGYLEGFLHWLDARERQSLAWQEAADFGDVVLYLTAEELAETVRALRKLIETAARRTSNRPVPSPDARMVQFVMMSYPLDDKDSGVG